MAAIIRGSGLLAAAVVAVSTVGAGSIAGCTPHGKKSGEPPPSSSPPVVSVTPSAPVSSSPPPEPVLPAGCPQLLPLGTVQQALGVGLVGEVTYLKAAPVPQSGRTGRVTCGYGTPTASPTSPATSGSAPPTPTGTPLVEASYITYVDAKTAAGRLALTVQSDGATSTISKVTVSGKPATVLVSPQWNELLMVDGARTLVVVVSPTVLTAAKAPAALVAMAEKMLAFGAPAGSGSASAGSGSPSAAASS